VPSRLNHDVRVARLLATIGAARVDAIDIVEHRRRFRATTVPSSITVKAMDPDESYGNTV